MCLDVRIKLAWEGLRVAITPHSVLRFCLTAVQYLMRGRGALVRGLLRTQCRWRILGIVHYENKIPQKYCLAELT